MTTIIGIDPGSRFTGFGVIVKGARDWQYAEHGVVNIPERLPLAGRLAFLAEHLRPVWQRWPGATSVIERVFLGKNVDSAFKLGHARGICLLLAAEASSPVVEYATRSAKKIVTGHGGATKEHVQLIVNQLLNAPKTMALDASDALALALCHARISDQEQRLRQLKENTL
jgi:crossover junction endodeoxyribonuclease RuvC